MALFLISFHDGEDELGGCFMRGATEEEALEKVTRERFAHQVGLPEHGQLLVTEMRQAAATLVPESFFDRLLTDDEFDHVYELLRPAATLSEGPALDAAVDAMTDQLKRRV